MIKNPEQTDLVQVRVVRKFTEWRRWPIGHIRSIERLQ